MPVKKTAGKKLAKTAKKTSSPAKKAADNVHETALRARDIGDTVVTAGHLIQETAEFIDALAVRAKSRAGGAGAKKR